MKQLKTLKSILVGVILLSLSPLATRADVVVNETNFPDPVFRSLIMSYSYLDNNPTILTNAEISKINSLVYEHANYSPSNQNIKSLKGIEYLASLMELRCMNNDISSADLSKNSELMFLDLSGNKLTNIDLSKNTKLKALCLSDNQLTSLDLTKNTWLENVQIQVNQLRAVRFSNYASNLVEVSCFHNQLNYAAMYRLITSLYVDLDHSKTRKLYAHSWIENTGEEGNCSIAADYASACGWTMRCYLPDQTEVPYSIYGRDPAAVTVNATNFPDDNFRSYIKSLDCVSGGKITAIAAAQVTTMNCSGKGIKSLKGIEYFTGLEELNCSNNDITELDVTKNVFLFSLDVSRNSIYGAQMGKVINTLPKLLKKACYDNELPGSGYGSFDCYYAYNTPTESNTYLEGNTLSLAQAQTCYNKYWTPTIYINGQMYNYWMYQTGYSMLQEAPLNINPKTFPDSYFRTALRSYNYGSDGQFYASEIASMTYLSVTNANITDFTGLHYFNALKILTLRGQTNLTSLDVSKNVNLEQLECSGNKLSSLSLTNNTKLKELQVYNTQLSSLNLYPVRNTLEILTCGNTKLTSLDLTYLTKLTELNCRDNGMTALNVSKNTALKILRCYGNNLTSLNLTKNTALTKLECNNNQLETLDLTNNTKLTTLHCEYNKLTSLSLPVVPDALALDKVYVYGNKLGMDAIEGIYNAFYSSNKSRVSIYLYDNTLGKEGNALNYMYPTYFKLFLSSDLYHYKSGSYYAYDPSNFIFPDDVSCNAGEEVALPIALVENKSINGFTFDLVLPDGVTLTNAQGETVISGHSVTYTKDATYSGVYHVTVSNGAAITGSGVLALKLTLKTTKVVNDLIRLQNVVFKYDNEGTITNCEIGPLTSNITVKPGKKGDVNGDGSITPADAIMILYHYFGVAQSGFNEANADLNGDGEITPADAIEALYKYFGASGARPTLPASLATEAGEPE